VGIKDRVSQAAAVTKWKVDQQRRLLKKQSEITDIENEVRIGKARLADAVLAVYEKENLDHEELKSACAEIVASLESIARKKSELDEIRRERPPDAAYTASPAIDDPNAASLSGLVCPECGRELVARFCPDHGREGVAKEPSDSRVEHGQQAPDQDRSLVCPECGRVLRGRFCPEHGVEGVPVEGTSQELEA